ncbi:hypothetical protein CDAR_212631 [Caerostris darwini]|uniref:Uncharacterized protein n=1 Tax=Caerostris darwini TaxID=1538125 RepID=A0AAV4PX96_9ARAC|nr:hypothetical protein CDAR_212631 [Caerostris darwini]
MVKRFYFFYLRPAKQIIGMEEVKRRKIQSTEWSLGNKAASSRTGNKFSDRGKRFHREVFESCSGRRLLSGEEGNNSEKFVRSSKKRCMSIIIYGWVEVYLWYF